MIDLREKEIKKKKFSHWQSFEYSKWFEDDIGMFIDIMEKSSISRTMHTHKKYSTLDVGIGNGRLFDTYSDNSRWIVGLDFSRNLIMQSKLLAEEKKIPYQCIVADVRHLPFKNNSFEFIISSRVLQHIPKRERGIAIGEMVRVTKSKGTLLLMLYNTHSLFGIAKLVLRATTKNYLRHSEFNTFFDIKAVLKALNVSVVRKEGAILFPVEFLKVIRNAQLRAYLLNIGAQLEKLAVFFPFKFLCGRLVIVAENQ